MSKRDLKKMVHYLTMVTFSITGHYTHDYRYGESRNPITSFLPDEHLVNARYRGVLPVPEGWHLGGTPLNGAIVNAMNFIPKYRTKSGIQNLNVVFITDGASNDNGNCKVDFNEESNDDDYNRYRSYPRGNTKTVYHDPITKKSYARSDFNGAGQVTTATLLTMLKDRTKCNVIGFFLSGTSGNNRVGKRDLQYMFPNQDVNVLKKVLRKEKVLVCESMGYDEYYFVPGGQNLDIETEELKVNGDMTRGKMAKGFTNYMRGKTVNRVLLNKFVEQIA